MPSDSQAPQPGLQRNVTLFILFRLLFNARFYYPIFALLFFDFGLTPADFFFLNGVVWTVASILLEVPSGALADQLGRRTLLIAAAILMLMEMAILCCMPFGGGAVVFGLFFLNRILSGAAEAAASGADEALAYDSMEESTREHQWPKVQSRLLIVQSIGMIIALNLGALGYRLDGVVQWLGLHWEVSRETALRIPLFLCLGSAFATLIVTLMMKEPPQDSIHHGQTIRQSFARTLRAGQWILQSHAPFLILLIFVLFDSIVRLYYTVSSSYYRIIGIDPIYFGLIGTLGNLLGIFGAPLIGWLVAMKSARFNYRLSAGLILVGLCAFALQLPVWGFLVLFPLGFGMRHLHAATSHYINRVTDSAHRATVLSFRGLAMMIFYGGVNLMVMVQTKAMIRTEEEIDNWNQELGNEIIRQTSPYWWIWFVIVLTGLFLLRRFYYRKPIDEIIHPPKKPA